VINRLWRYRWFRRAWRALFVATDRLDPVAVAHSRVKCAALALLLPSHGEMRVHIARARRTVQAILD